MDEDDNGKIRPEKVDKVSEIFKYSKSAKGFLQCFFCLSFNVFHSITDMDSEYTILC